MFTAARRARLAMATQILDIDPVFEAAAQRAGRAAEQEFIAWLRKEAKGAQIFHSKRIARGTGTGRYEIDVILLTPTRLTVIELKNWSGQIGLRGKEWIKRREDGTWLTQEDPVAKTALKLDALERFCLERGLRLPPWISTAVVVWNEQARLDPKIRANPAVVLKENAACLLPKEGRGGGLSRAQMQALGQALANLESFDSVTLFGGRVVQGDLLRLATRTRGYRLDQLPQGTHVRLKAPRSPLWVRAKALFGFGPMIAFDGALKGLQITPRDRLIFHPAGEIAPIEIPLGALRSLKKG